MKKLYTLSSIVALSLAGLGLQAQVVLKNHSKVPALVIKKDLQNLEVYSLVNTGDVLPLSPNFVFGGSADGAGLLKNQDGTFTYVVNHEDNFAVSRITFDNKFAPTKGEYILNSNAGQWRLCSATLATPAEHGFGPVFITCGESGVESMTHAINPLAPAVLDSLSSLPNLATGLGRWSAENAVPLHKNAYANKTVVLLGDDDSGKNGGQMVLYVADAVGDLKNGKLYALKRKDGKQSESDMKAGVDYQVEFVQFPSNYKSISGLGLDTIAAGQLAAIKFGRVEDIDYRKGSAANNRTAFFTVTGQDTTGINADKSRTKFGRVYQLSLSENDPTQGVLRCLLDGDDASPNNPARVFNDPDNITVTEDFVYVQEDPNGYTMSAADQAHNHDARIYQFNLVTGEFNTVFELDHRRTAADKDVYNKRYDSATDTYVNADSRTGSWEYGALIDVSADLGIANTFLLNIQPHTWLAKSHEGVDGGTLRRKEAQGSQVIVIKGLPTKNGASAINTVLANSLNIYPNPNNGLFTVALENDQPTSIEVIDLLGQVVYSKVITQTGLVNNELNLSGFANGAYIVKVSNEAGSAQKMLTKF